jgi:cell division protein FtsB
MKSVMVVLFALLCVLQYKLWFDQGGVNETLQLDQEIKEQTLQNLLLSDRNQSLAAEVADLKSGQDAIEERARNELGMVKSGEVFYQIVPSHS